MKAERVVAYPARGSNVPFADLSAAAKAEAASAASFGHPQGSGRKAVLSALVAAGWGSEIVGMYSAHGTNATLPGGPYSLAPYKYYVDVAQAALAPIYNECGADLLLDQLHARWLDTGGIQSVIIKSKEAIEDSDFEYVPLPGFSSLPYPTPEVAALFGKICAAASDMLTAGSKLSRDDLRRVLLLLLLESGVPLKNLRRYRIYYRLGSLLHIDEQPAYFVVLLRQSDGGLGLLPLRLKRPELVSRVISRLKRYLSPTPRMALFGDFEIGETSLYNFVARLLPLTAGEHSLITREKLVRLLDQGATFVAQMELGGFLATGLRDELASPPNSYHVPDSLRAMGIARRRLSTIDGSKWTDPYAPTRKQRARETDVPALVNLLTGSLRSDTRRGRPRKLPVRFSAFGPALGSWSDSMWAKLVGHYWPQPTRARIRRLLLSSGACEESQGWRRAARIYHLVSVQGSLASAPQHRLLGSISLTSFLQHVARVELPRHAKSESQLNNLTGLMYTVGAIGTRTHEAAKIRACDWTRVDDFELLRLRGTKVHRARREPSLDIFPVGPCGSEVYSHWQTLLLAAVARTPSGEALFPAGEGKRSRYELLNRALDDGFRTMLAASGDSDVSGDEGRFSSYDLRRAAVLRLIQGAIDTQFLHGNFLAALAQAAAAFGHSFSVFLSHYLGCAAVVLKYPHISLHGVRL